MAKNPRNDFPDLSRQINAGEKFFRSLPKIVGNAAVNHFKDNFKREGFWDKGVKKWAPRKRHEPGKNILVQSGRLRRSIRHRTFGSRVVVFTDGIPYAKIHNEGGRVSGTAKVKAHNRKIKRGRTTKIVAVRAHNRSFNYTMPQRQFMGNSTALNRKIEKYVAEQFNKIFN